MASDNNRALIEELRSPEYLHYCYGKAAKHSSEIGIVLSGDPSFHPDILVDVRGYGGEKTFLYKKNTPEDLERLSAEIGATEGEISDLERRLGLINKGPFGFIHRSLTRRGEIKDIEYALCKKRAAVEKLKMREQDPRFNPEPYLLLEGHQVWGKDESSWPKPSDNFQAKVFGSRFMGSYIFSMYYPDNTNDNRGGAHVCYALAIPKDKISEIVPKIAENPQLLIELFRSVYPDGDNSKGTLRIKEGADNVHISM